MPSKVLQVPTYISYLLSVIGFMGRICHCEIIVTVKTITYKNFSQRGSETNHLKKNDTKFTFCRTVNDDVFQSIEYSQ